MDRIFIRAPHDILVALLDRLDDELGFPREAVKVGEGHDDSPPAITRSCTEILEDSQTGECLMVVDHPDVAAVLARVRAEIEVKPNAQRTIVDRAIAALTNTTEPLPALPPGPPGRAQRLRAVALAARPLKPTRPPIPGDTS
jgi:hypothetical protein